MGVTRGMCWETGKATIWGMVAGPPPGPNRRRRGSRKIGVVQSKLHCVTDPGGLPQAGERVGLGLGENPPPK